MLTEQSALLREICNGIMCVSAVILVGIFAHYVFRTCRKDYGCFRDSAVWAACALIILLVGHAMRAFSGWMQFLFIRNGWDAEFWINGTELFLSATALIILAKVLMVYTFAPYRLSFRLALFAVLMALAIPISVVIVTW